VLAATIVYALAGVYAKVFVMDTYNVMTSSSVDEEQNQSAKACGRPLGFTVYRHVPQFVSLLVSASSCEFMSTATGRNVQDGDDATYWPHPTVSALNDSFT
jgi:hypothetical protein